MLLIRELFWFWVMVEVRGEESFIFWSEIFGRIIVVYVVIRGYSDVYIYDDLVIFLGVVVLGSYVFVSGLYSLRVMMRFKVYEVIKGYEWVVV